MRIRWPGGSIGYVEEHNIRTGDAIRADSINIRLPGSREKAWVIASSVCVRKEGDGAYTVEAFMLRDADTKTLASFSGPGSLSRAKQLQLQIRG